MIRPSGDPRGRIRLPGGPPPGTGTGQGVGINPFSLWDDPWRTWTVVATFFGAELPRPLFYSLFCPCLPTYHAGVSIPLTASLSFLVYLLFVDPVQGGRP